MSTAKRFEDLQVWQTARKLTQRVYQLSAQGSFAHDFALKDQMRRAAISIMSNIAEGFESRTSGLFIEFLGRAKGSAGELRAQCYVTFDGAHLGQNQFELLKDDCEKCSGQLSRLIEYLQGNVRKVKTAARGA